ncbi:hypothetical protein BMF94_1539 [Rhodotorula taiwanensis]|uniref:Mitochondrial zinc maintenance protein 1, mitochondrial n=1 Tax=Rhodotorula taiwanensis TaxID=741276 RepID=A0A2S5BF42_9BASI|nr:hypothetical protein BMF94_1539 [Rhodotorula taiwanensis]
MPPKRVTGLQRQVLHLYKRALQMVAAKPIPSRPSWYAFVSHQFRHPTVGGGLRKRDVAAIEHLLRRGNKMVDQYGQSSVTAISLPEDTEEYPLGWVAKGGKDTAR